MITRGEGWQKWSELLLFCCFSLNKLDLKNRRYAEPAGTTGRKIGANLAGAGASTEKQNKQGQTANEITPTGLRTNRGVEAIM